jgi:uncharacterized protein YndB with AHSA1/START domain
MPAFDLCAEQHIDAAPEAVFDAFIDMHGADRPDWIADSQLDLRVGGRWSVGLRPPGLAPFREVRVITALRRPGRLAYRMEMIPSDDRPGFSTSVSLSFQERGQGTCARLEQRGFPSGAARDDFARAWPDVLASLGPRARRI